MLKYCNKKRIDLKKYNIAVVGASGAVGEEIFRVLEEQKFPVANLLPLASANSAGNIIEFAGDEYNIEELTEDVFKGRDIDIAFFSAGGAISAKYVKYAIESGALVIDNTSHFRMVEDIPLVVPEVNPEDIKLWENRGIIANPNCSTIQMVVALNPIHRQWGLKRVVVSTYQAVSGTGKKAIDELLDQSRAMLNFLDYESRVYPHRIAFNCLPHIDVFLENGYTKEEMKMVNETRKILEDDAIAVTATTVRVPVFYGHSESVNVETHRAASAREVRALLEKSPGIKVMDDPANNVYPLATDAAGQDLTLVGRIRDDASVANGINLWIVADNIRKGAATNTVQIARVLADEYL